MSFFAATTAAAVSPPVTADVLAWCADRPVPFDRTYAYSVDVLRRELRDFSFWADETNVLQANIWAVPNLSANRFDLREPTRTDTLHGSQEFLPLSGIKGDGLTGYIDPGRTGPELFAASHGTILMLSNSSDFPVGDRGDCGTRTTGSQIGFYSYDGATAGFWFGAVQKITQRATSALGLAGVGRIDAATVRCIYGGGSVDVLHPSGAVPTGPFYWGRLVNGYSINVKSFGFVLRDAPSPTAIRSANASLRRFLFAHGTLAEDEEPEPLGPHYFTRAMRDLVPERIIMQGLLPPNDAITQADWHGFPCDETDGSISSRMVAGGNITQTQVKFWARLWGNRFDGGRHNKPNPFEGGITALGKSARGTFSTVRLADGATMANAAKLLGYSEAEILNIAASYGYDVSLGFDHLDGCIFRNAYAKANAATIFNAGSYVGYNISRDKIVQPIYAIPQVLYTPVLGLWWDCEMGDGATDEAPDGRTPEQFIELATALSDLCVAKGKTFSIGCNALHQGATYRSGLRAWNAPILLALPGFRQITVTVTRDPPDNDIAAFLSAQHALFGSSAEAYADKLAIHYSLGRPVVRQDIVLAARQFARDRGYGAIRITRGYAVQGGGFERDVNQRIGSALWLPGFA